MNPVFKIINNALITINRLIDSMPMKTVLAIKRGFLFITFLMCIAGIIVGYNMGTRAAKIKSPPLAEFVNDTFNIDMSREKDKGSFSGMLESEMVKESDAINSNKVDFFVRERMNPEVDNNVIDTGKSVSEPGLGERVYKPETPVDEDKRFTGPDDSRINVIDRNLNNEKGDDGIIRDKKDETKKTGNGTSGTGDNKTDIRMLQKDKTVTPKTIQKDQGILDQ